MPATALQLRGGTTAQHAAFTGLPKEVTVDTTKKTLVVHDGATAGGTALLTAAALVNTALTGAPTAPNPATGARSTAIATMQKFADEFTSLKSQSGWQKLASGLIVQWFSPLNSNNIGVGYSSNAFPIAFPNACLMATATPLTASSKSFEAGFACAVSTTPSSINWVAYLPSGAVHSNPNFLQATILAIGY